MCNYMHPWPLAVQGVVESLLAQVNDVSVVGLCIVWPFCQSCRSIRKLVVSHLRHSLKLRETSARVAGVQVTSTGHCMPCMPCI
jgi:hypothetical protein